MNALACLLTFGKDSQDHLRVPRFRLRNKLSRAIAVFFGAPEIK
jgi:hypothetical protein